MKAIFIIYNQAYNEEIVSILEKNGQRGFTKWNEISGRGSVEGEPHYGDHAWPVMNDAVVSIVEDGIVQNILDELKTTDENTPDLGLRAFVLPVDKIY